jgi:hypothetical protein
MTARRRFTFGILGALLAVTGFLIGRSLGGDTAAPEFGSTPATIATGRPEASVPSYAPEKSLPTLVVTTPVTSVETGESETPAESGTVTPIVEEVPEKKEAPHKTTPPPEPGITVGGSEE